MALLLRSRLESHKSRTIERACLQLQALVDQFGIDESSPAERMQHIFSILIPPKWEMEVFFIFYICANRASYVQACQMVILPDLVSSEKFFH